MEGLAASLRSIQDRLKRAGIDCVVIGALAVAAWGEPRATRDIDLKIRVTREDCVRLVEVLGSDFDCLGVDPLDTLERHGMLFVRDASGTRIDFLLSETDFDEIAITRGKSIELLPCVEVRVCTAEDLVVYKLLSSRPRDGSDAETVVQRQGLVLDVAYVTSWLQAFEEALDDSTLVTSFQHMMRTCT